LIWCVNSDHVISTVSRVGLEAPAQEAQIMAEVCRMVSLYYAQLRQR
jgi:hypothetical protein